MTVQRYVFFTLLTDYQRRDHQSLLILFQTNIFLLRPAANAEVAASRRKEAIVTVRPLSKLNKGRHISPDRGDLLPPETTSSSNGPT